LILIFLTLPSMTKTPDKYKNFLSIKNLFFSFSCLIFFRNFCNCKKRKFGFLSVFVLYILYLSATVNGIFIMRVWEFGLSYAVKINSYETPYHINFLGIILNFGLFFLGWLFTKLRSRMKFVILILGGLSITISIFLTLSKIAFILLVLNLCFILKYSFNVKMRYIFICILIFFCIMLMHSEIQSRFSTLIFGKYYLDRLRLFSDGIKVVSFSPVVGIGGLNFGYFNMMFKKNNIFLKVSRNGTYAHCHNTLLELLLSYGVIFFIFFLIFLYFLFSKGFSDSENRRYFIFFLVIIALNSIVEDWFWMSRGYIFFALLGSLCWIKGSKEISRSFKYVFLILFIFCALVFTRYNYSHMITQNIFAETNKSADLNIKINLLEKSTTVLPFSSDIYRYLCVFNIFKGNLKDGFEYLEKSIHYSRFELEFSLLRIWKFALQGINYNSSIKFCQSLSPDEDGLAELTYALVGFYTGNLAESIQHFANYLIKFPIFIKDVFFTLNPDLRKQVLTLIDSKDYQLQLYKEFKKIDFINLRISRIFYKAEIYDKSKKYFLTVNRNNALNQELNDEFDVYLKKEFINEYELMHYRLTGSIDDIKWDQLSTRDEIYNEIIPNLYCMKRYQEAVVYSDKFINWRKVDNFTQYLSEKFPGGLFYGILSAISINDIQKAKKYSEFLLTETPSNFLGYLGLSFCSTDENQMKYFDMAVSSFLNKRHLFYKKNFLLIFVCFKPDWIKTYGIPIVILNNLEYVPFFIEKWLLILKKQVVFN